MQMPNSVTIDSKLNKSNILWRYLDLPKYLDLLRSKAIYFSRADRFPDKFEGVLTPSMRRALNKAYKNGESDYDADSLSRELKEGIYVNCWSLGAKDNMALWQLYSSLSTGVVVTTTINKLTMVSLEWAPNEQVEIFKVRYIDHFKNPDMIVGTYSDPLRYKNSAYSFENEVRLVISRIEQNKNAKHKPDAIVLPVELKYLIRSVVVPPEAGQWFFELILDVTNRYEASITVHRSELTFLPK